MSLESLTFDIENYISRFGLGYQTWAIGVTDDAERKRQEQEQAGEDVKLWQSWDAGDEIGAREVEDHFLWKGMRGIPVGGTKNNHIVFVF